MPLALRLHSKQILPWSDGLILLSLWLLATLCDRLWLGMDHAVPAWDQGEHLTRALNYLRVLQKADLLSGDWWTELWRLSPSYRAPLVYLVTTPFLAWVGREFDQATLVHLPFSALLLISLYALGRCCFDRTTGLWAAGFCILLPVLAILRIDYLLDYELVALFSFTLVCITAWRWNQVTQWGWLLALGIGLGLGLTFLTKTTGVIFLSIPLVWIGAETLLKRRWNRLLQLGVAILLGAAIDYPWFSTNWVTILSGSLHSNATWVPDGLKPGDTIGAWLYYFRQVPKLVPWPLLLVSLGAWVLLGGLQVFGRASQKISLRRDRWVWLLGFLVGTYLLMTSLQNKDPRHIVPAVPVLVLVLVRGLVLLPALWGLVLRWGTATGAFLCLLLSIFPLPGAFAGGKFPYQGPELPHSQIIKEVAQTEPYLRSTIGVLCNTSQVNPMNIDLFGAIANFQVFGRELSLNPTFVAQDGRSLHWFLAKTGEQGPDNGQAEAKTAIRQWVAQSADLQLQRQWSLPDGSQLSLYRQKTRPLVVSQLTTVSESQVQLDRITVPAQARPGQPIPITYEWSGPWDQLQDGLVELTWQNVDQPDNFWLHDHGLGLGQLYRSELSPGNPTFQLTENLATLTAQVPGKYRLQATYLNRRTGDRTKLTVPDIQIELTPQAKSIAAPELDLVTQFRQLSLNLPMGKLDPVFEQIGRINQYDPVQDYLVQTELILRDRLKESPQAVSLAYNLALVYVLQQRAKPAIEQFQQITQLDASNPWAWTYLGFVHLYHWQPGLAARALDQALSLNPKLDTAKTLRGVAAILQLDLGTAKNLLL